MQPERIYLLHPNATYLPDAAEWVQEVEVILAQEDSWQGCRLVVTPYDEQNRFVAQLVAVQVHNKPGPVVLLENVQGKSLRELKSRLRTRAIIMVQSVMDSASLWEVLEEARRRFDLGEPFLPRKFVVAVLIVRKLRKGNYWGGNAKGYLWYDDLAKGRGVDERYADIAQVVANDLLQHKILIYKVSQGKKKYALNPAIKPEIHAIADRCYFMSSRLEEILNKDSKEVSSNLLHTPESAEQITITGDGIPTFEGFAIQDAVAHVQGYQQCPKYNVFVRFAGGNQILRETITERHILIQFLEAFH